MTAEQRLRPETPHAATMAAIVQDGYGEAEQVLRLGECPRPEPGPGEVLVRVRAAGVDRGTWHVVTGRPAAIRLVTGVRRPRNPVPGMDVAGTVEAAGEGVGTFAVGDEVFGASSGSYAEYALASAAKLAHRPASLTAVQAAAMPVSGCTALQAVRDRGKVRAGDSVLILGASGGVGTFAVRIAAILGAHVTGVCSEPKAGLVRSLGAGEVLTYPGAELGRGRYDVIVDIGGNRPLGELRRALTPRGTLVITGGETGGRWLGGVDRQLRAMALSPFTAQTLGTFVAVPRAADLAHLAELAESGQLTSAVDRTFELAEAAAAIRYLAEGRARGKVVLSVRG